MDLFKLYRDRLVASVEALVQAGQLPAGLDLSAVTVEPPRESGHGDFATNAALVLARQARRKPADLARLLAESLARLEGVAAVEVAGPGFINLRLEPASWHKLLRAILDQGARYGASAIGAGRRVNVEYVSANPTGPLHVGHARGAVFGDVLASLLANVGYDVTREYYVNDAGRQLEALARSVHWRYREALGERVDPMTAEMYPGDYLIPVGKKLAMERGRELLDMPESGEINELGWGVGGWREECANFGRDEMINLIRDDLAALGISFDNYVYERELHRSEKVAAAVKLLEAKGLIYTGVLEPPKGKMLEDWEPRPQTLFRSTRFGDDVDRPLKKSDGSWTYFAADIAYHLDKFERGFADMIDVWGADHGGYVKRMKAAVAALTEGKATLDVKVCQLVNLLEHGEPVKMSKRAGRFVTLRDVVEAVGKDVVRFIMLTRRNDAALDFDLAKVTEHSRENPVFYVQYAHARICSVMRHAGEAPGLIAPAAPEPTPPEWLRRPDELARLTDCDEIGLIRSMAAWPRLVEGAAEAHEPHRLAFYLYDLAAAFHGLWNRGNEEPGLRFIVHDDPGLTRARLALIGAVRQVIASGLAIFGVTPVEEMR